MGAYSTAIHNCTKLRFGAWAGGGSRIFVGIMETDQSKKVKSSSNPWITIWTEPRATIASIVESNLNRAIWLLAAIYGFSSLLNSFQTAAIGQQIGLFQIFFLAALLSPIWGYVILNAWSFFVSFTGKLFKGAGSFKEVRAAYAWSFVPLSVNAAIWIILGVVFGREFFMNTPDTHPFTQLQVSIYFVAVVVRFITAIWAVVIYVNTLSQVQKYSVLKAIGNMIVASICLIVVLYLVLILALKGLGGVAAVFHPAQFAQILLNLGGVRN